MSEEAASLKKPPLECKEKSPSLDTETLEDEDTDSYPSTGEHAKIVMEATPVRQSTRMAGKTLKYYISYFAILLVLLYLIAEKVLLVEDLPVS